MPPRYRKLQATLRAILESPKDIVIFALDRSYCYLAFNENHFRTMRYIWGVDIHVGDDMLALIGREDDRNKARKNFDRALSGENFTVIEEYGSEKINRRIYEDVYSPIRDPNGEIIGLTLYLTDITEQRFAELELEKYRSHLEELVQERTNQLEAAHRQLLHAQKLESLGVLAGGVAHDFNNLLAVILGRSELAACSKNRIAIRNHLNMIRDTVLEARSLTKQLLGYSGKGQFLMQVVCLNDLVESMKQLLRASVNKSIQLDYELADELPSVEVDSTQICQVIMNLVTNAAESITRPVGRVTTKTYIITIESRSRPNSSVQIEVEEGRYVCLEIVDTGCGMTDEVRAKIFDPFFTTKFSGRGLGLAAVLGIVRSHQGGILLTTKPKKGTAIKILLPIADKIATPLIKSAECGTRRDYKGEGCILVVDDEPPARRVTREMLESLGFSVITAQSGKDAVCLYEEQQKIIDLVILDLTMPEMNGVETLKMLKKINSRINVIVMTGYSEETLRLSFSEYNIQGFLIKPFNYDELISAVDAGFAQKHRSQETTDSKS